MAKKSPKWRNFAQSDHPVDTSTCFQSFSGEKTDHWKLWGLHYKALYSCNAAKHLASTINLFTPVNKTNVLPQSYKLVIESKVCAL